MAWTFLSLFVHLYLELRIKHQAGNLVKVMSHILTVKLLTGHHVSRASLA